MGELMRKIMTNNPRPIPSQYSSEFRELINMMLKKNPNERASIYDILQLPLIRNKAIALLGKTQARSELNHQVFHGVKAGETPSDIPDEINLPFVSHHENESQNDQTSIEKSDKNESNVQKEKKSQEKLKKALKSMADNLKEVINGNFDISTINEAQEEMNDGDFYFMGRKLVLNSVKNDDPLAYKLESVRLFLEEMLGIEKFKEIYKVASEEESTQLLKLTQSDAYVFQLVLQLVAYESRP